MTSGLVRWLPAIAWMVFIFAMSSREQFPQPGGISPEILPILGHLFLYGTLAILVLVAIEPYLAVGRAARVTAVVLATLYGVTDEFHQSFVPGRDASLFDVVVNAIGATVAVTVWSHRQRLVTLVRSR